MTDALTVYVHLPWCLRKCTYCDFNSHAAPAHIPEQRYVNALLADLAAQAPEVADRRVGSVFFGGGTPSLFSPAAIGAVIDAIVATFAVEPDLEITLEANPGTVERHGFAGYVTAGVNRVSLGAQSFSGTQLARLGRIHSPKEIAAAVGEIRRAGIGNFNLDLMYALPEQTLTESLDDVRAAIDLDPVHLSHYQLTLEPGTALYYRPPKLPDDETAFAMQLACQELLADAGFGQYEVSAYARDGYRCRHNLAYWRFGDYLGIGAGAHGKITLPSGVWRTEMPRMPRDYMAGVESGSAAARHRVEPAELPFEWALNTLRLTEGGKLTDFEAGTGLPASVLEPTLHSLAARGLVALDERTVRTTAMGSRFLNDVQAAFLR